MLPLPIGIKNREDLSVDLKKNSFTAILLIDINNFNQINEQIGRENGDKILDSFMKFLKKFNQNNSYDIYRLYGDGFILRETDKEFELEKYERDIPELFKGIEDLFSKESIKIEATVGICFEEKQALEKVDIALQYAKEHNKQFIAYSGYILS